jgi:hypothetical protein
VEFDLGPNFPTGFDHSETDISLGIGAGVVATRTEQLDVVPTGSIAFANADRKSIPFGLSGAATTFGITLAVNFSSTQ